MTNDELTFQYISQYLHDQKWWKNEKQRLKAIKVYKKLKLEELYNIAKQDNGKYKSNFQASINDWCKRCINDKQWKKLKNSINQAKLQAETKESNQEKTISLSNKAYELLHNAARQKKSSISDLIIPLLEHKRSRPEPHPTSRIEVHLGSILTNGFRYDEGSSEDVRLKYSLKCF